MDEYKTLWDWIAIGFWESRYYLAKLFLMAAIHLDCEYIQEAAERIAEVD